MRQPPNYFLYATLITLLVIASSWQFGFADSVVDRLLNGAREARAPVVVENGSNELAVVLPEAAEAGVHPGDRLIGLEEQSYRGKAQLAQALAATHPGAAYRITVLQNGGERKWLAVIVLRAHEPLSTASALNLTISRLLVPVLCLLLGFTVAFIRIRDPLAWALLGLTLSIGAMTAGDDAITYLWKWPAGIRPAAITYDLLFGATWPLWLFVFAVYFPERWKWDNRLPWLKWTVIVPLSFRALIEIAIAVGDSENFASVVWLSQHLNGFDLFVFVSISVAIAAFFTSLVSKMRAASSEDSRRRLRLLLWGSWIAFTPVLLLSIYGTMRGWREIPESVWIAVSLLAGVFPLTLAYVIVVQRAMDVRVVVRQGLQYALASGAIRTLQGLALIAVTVAAVLLATDSSHNRPQKIGAICAGVAFGVFIHRGGERLRRSIDRRFFREAYNAEELFNDLSDRLRTMIETRPLLETVGRKIAESLHVRRIAILLSKNGTYAPAYTLGYTMPLAVEFRESSAALQCLRNSHEPLRVYFDDPNSWMYRAKLPDAELDNLRQLDSQLLLQLEFKDRVIGVVSLGPKQSEEPYSPSDLRLLLSLAIQTALALETSRLTEAISGEIAQRERLSRELEIAREVQERLFPQSIPSVPGLDLAGQCRPAFMVGGDYFDFLSVNGASLGIAIGDVSGKGIPAALLMAWLQASLRSQATLGISNLADLMSNLNRLTYEATRANRYATFFYAQYDPARRRLDYVNGGHNPPLLFREGGVTRLDGDGPVLGLLYPANYGQKCVELQAGDLLVFFTDGISERMNAADEEWGEERLIETIRLGHQLTSSQLMHEIMSATDRFAGDIPQNDDMTLIVANLL